MGIMEEQLFLSPGANVFATYGPRGATLSHSTTVEEGIHLEACNSDNGQTIPEDKNYSVDLWIVMQPTDDCIELEGWYCQLEVGDAFAVPSKLCEDTGSLPTDVTCKMLGHTWISRRSQNQNLNCQKTKRRHYWKGHCIGLQ